MHSHIWGAFLPVVLPVFSSCSSVTFTMDYSCRILCLFNIICFTLALPSRRIMKQSSETMLRKQTVNKDPKEQSAKTIIQPFVWLFLLTVLNRCVSGMMAMLSYCQQRASLYGYLGFQVGSVLDRKYKCSFLKDGRKKTVQRDDKGKSKMTIKKIKMTIRDTKQPNHWHKQIG